MGDNPIIGCLLVIAIILAIIYGVGKQFETTTTNTRTIDDPQQTRTVGTMREVNTINLNMRSGPGSGYSVVATFPKQSRLVSYGETITVGSELWIQASTPDGQTRGWVNRKYLSP
jgi:SH3-like domain-containing protein